MPEITYESIKPLIVTVEQRGRSMWCQFKCPISDLTVNSSAVVQQSTARELAGHAQQTVKRRLVSSTRTAVSRAIFKSLGHNLLGYVGHDLTNTAMSRVNRKAVQPTFSNAEKRAAIVAAFERVASRFAWDKRNKRWISARASQELLNEFDQRLRSAPIAHKYDLGVLARMLIEVSNADGRMTREEKAFLSENIPAQVTGSVNELLRRPPLSKVELEETTPGASRETMLMLTWALACTDEKLAAEEQARLLFFAEGLQIPERRAAEIRQGAQSFALEQMLEQVYAGDKMNIQRRKQAMALAAQMGMTDEEAERADVRYRKRAGIL